MHPNVQFAWSWILCGLISGGLVGLFFHDPDWLGGYDSWRRRMVRLGHISFLGTGLLNLCFGVCAVHEQFGTPPTIASAAFVGGGVTMPIVCFLSAWNDRWRHWFFVPVACLAAATGEVAWRSFFP